MVSRRSFAVGWGGGGGGGGGDGGGGGGGVGGGGGGGGDGSIKYNLHICLNNIKNKKITIS